MDRRELAVIGMDPGLKYCGIALGAPFDLTGINFKINSEFDHPLLIAMQHVAVISAIYEAYLEFESNVPENSPLRVGYKFSQINIEIADEREKYSESGLEDIVEVSAYLERLLEKWILFVNKDDTIKIQVFSGYETKVRRSELRINKTDVKSSDSRMAHINDAIALLMMSYHQINSNNKPNFDLIHKNEVTYFDIYKSLPEEYLQYSRNMLELELANFLTVGEISDLLKKWCDLLRLDESDMFSDVMEIVNRTPAPASVPPAVIALPVDHDPDEYHIGLGMGNPEFSGVLEEGNMDYVFSFQCKKKWGDLELTDVESARFCDSCNKEVFYATSLNELVRLAQSADCVALAVPSDPNDETLEIPRNDGVFMMGELKPPDFW